MTTKWATDQSAIRTWPSIRTWPCMNIVIFTHNLGNWLILNWSQRVNSEYLETREELSEAAVRADPRPTVTLVFLDPDAGRWCLPDESQVDCGSKRQLALLAVLRAVSPPLSFFWHNSLFNQITEVLLAHVTCSVHLSIHLPIRSFNSDQKAPHRQKK